MVMSVEDKCGGSFIRDLVKEVVDDLIVDWDLYDIK
jgi:hypothetical protein